jgi:hypothetical protein
MQLFENDDSRIASGMVGFSLFVKKILQNANQGVMADRFVGIPPVLRYKNTQNCFSIRYCGTQKVSRLSYSGRLDTWRGPYSRIWDHLWLMFCCVRLKLLMQGFLHFL